MKEFIHKNPLIQGLRWHSSLNNSFLLSTNWYQCYWRNDSDDFTTRFAVNCYTRIDNLFEVFTKYIEKLPACNSKASNQKIAGTQLLIETKYTCGRVL